LRFSLLAGSLIRLHDRMPKRGRRVLSGALLGAAATALTVKGALTGPLGASDPTDLDELQHGLGATKDAALAQSKTVLDQATERLVAAVARVPSGSPKPTAPASSQSTPTPPATVTAPPTDRQYSRRMLRQLLREAAIRHHLDPKLVLAVSYWESGWDPSKVSATGARGLMQVEPATAQEAGPSLLGRTVDITDPYDNADIGAAILKEDLDTFKDPAMALAAYYQGPSSLRANGMFPDTQQYVQGILDLAARMS
jgi:soluble lytic murein transglycosylase-like protein